MSLSPGSLPDFPSPTPDLTGFLSALLAPFTFKETFLLLLQLRFNWKVCAKQSVQCLDHKQA